MYDGLCDNCTTYSIMIRRYAESNIPVEYWTLAMNDKFKGEAKLVKYYDLMVSDLPRCYNTGFSLCFAGGHGIGKTMTMTNVLKKACVKGYICLYSTLSDIVSALLVHDAEERFLARRELMSVDFLVIDEFDSRFMPSDNASDLFGRTLENVFRTRAQNKMPTLMCSNSPKIELAFQGAIQESLGSLLKGYVKTVNLMGDDFRKTRTIT